MKNLSATTRDLIVRLYAPVKVWKRLTSSVDSHEELLRQIGAHGEPMAIPVIAPFLIHDRLSTARTALKAIHLLMRRLLPSDFIQLDQEMRQRSPYHSLQWTTWHQLRPEELDRLAGVSETSWLILALASFHRNGYVRQAAVEKLSLFSDGRELPFLLIRLNDWVPTIRASVQNALSRRIVPDYAPHFVANLALVLNLLERGRNDHHQFVELILSLVKRPECAGALIAGLTSTDRFVSRRCFELITEVPGIDVRAIIEQALKSKDTLIRLWAARRVRSADDGNLLAELLQVMWRDRFMPVRQEALSTYIEKFPDERISKLRAALLDDHVSMRELAHYHLRNAGDFDFASFYRVAISHESRSLYAAISGLGETGTTEDVDVILPFVAHTSPKVRRATVQAVSKLRGDSYIELFLDKLMDDVPSVSYAARDALRVRVSLIRIDRLWQIFNQSSPPHTKRAVLFLIAIFPKWESLPLLIKACGSSNDQIAAAAREYVQRWMWRYNRSFLPPSKQQLNLLSQALEESEAGLDMRVVEDFRQLIIGWRKA